MPSTDVIDGPYLQDLLAQPDVFYSLREALTAQTFPSEVVQELRSGKYRRVVLTGMGSSLHAQYPLHRSLSAAGYTSHWIETAELLLGFEPYFGKDTLLVAVSQSGESAEIVRLLERRADFGHIIGITNNPASTLARQSSTIFLLHAGPESSVSCKTYLNTLAVLHWLGARLTGNPCGNLQTVENAVRVYLEKWREHVAELLPLLTGIRDIFVTGRGDSLATAGTGGLILKESTRLHAEGMSAPAFRHGPLEMAGPGVLVLIFAGNADIARLHQRLASEIERGGARACLIGPDIVGPGVFNLPDLPSELLPFVEILSIQMVSLALAARDGFEAGRFQRASKITDIA